MAANPTRTDGVTGRADRVEPIQWLRGVAAMLVVCNHAGLLALKFLEIPETPSSSTVWNLARFGAFGVDIFFVISGFVMAMSARRFDGGAGAARFLVQRYNRIAPLFYLLSAVLFADLIRAHVAYSPLEVFNTLAFIPWLDGTEYHWPIHYLGWTLAFEFVFYLVVGALIWAGRGRDAALLALVLILLALIGFVADLPWMPWRMLTSPMMVEFASGALLYVAFGRGWFDRSHGLWRALALASLFVLAWPVFSATSLLADVGSRQFEYGGAALRLLWWGVPALAIVAAFLTLTVSSDGLVRRVALAIGDATYSIYLTHLFVVRLAEEVIERTGASPVLVAIGVVLVSPLVGVACYRLVEAPLMRQGQRAITRWFGTRATGQQPAAGRSSGI